ncbi:uncharacterized protein [Nothobranchius furzeri]
MSVEFSGWEVVDDGACFPGVILGPSQAPQNKGVYTMFHGTHVSSARAIITSGFQPSGGGTLGKGVYVSRDKNKASNYPLFGNSSDQVILEVRVRVGRVKRIDPADIQMRITWSTHGYNTAWIPPANAISGLEEDCVFDPKRVTVVGIAKAPNAVIEKELRELISKASKTVKGATKRSKPVCSLCKRKTQQDAPHYQQQCWKCGKTICILMSKHFCTVKPYIVPFFKELNIPILLTDHLFLQDLDSIQYWSKMSLQFFGWEVTYDDSSSRLELGASQQPKDKGVYTMYHGTSIANARNIITNGFKQSQTGMLGKGVYVSRDRKKAERYPLHNSSLDRVVLELHIRVGRVKRIDTDNHPMQYTWSSQGYDTAWVPPNCGMKAVPSGLEEDCVFDPKRVKVVAIARAPDTEKAQLKQLLANSPVNGSNAAAATNVCSLCKRKQQQSSPHIKQQCWGCGQNICILMIKHVCSRSAQNP